MTPDPLFLQQPDLCAGDPAQCSLYIFAKNAPLDFDDPSGLAAEELWGRSTLDGHYESAISHRGTLHTRRETPTQRCVRLADTPPISTLLPHEYVSLGRSAVGLGGGAVWASGKGASMAIKQMAKVSPDSRLGAVVGSIFRTLRIKHVPAYDFALQAEGALYKNAAADIRNGRTLVRTEEFGKQKTTDAFHWSLDNPYKNLNYAKDMGMNGGAKIDFVLFGGVKPNVTVVTRTAGPIAGNPGGGLEAVTRPGGVRLRGFHMPD